MTTQNDTHDVEAIARELMEARMQSVRDLADASDARAAAEEAFAAADAEYVRGYAAATKVGWSEAELAKMKLVKPGTRARRRPASRSAVDRGATGAAVGDGGQPQSDGAASYS